MPRSTDASYSSSPRADAAAERSSDAPLLSVTPDASLSLDERVRELLSEFRGSVAFQGLRRTLGVHPESLTRALRRLEREGAVERTQEGYRLTGSSNLDARATWTRPGAPRWEEVPRVELRLSPGENASQLMRSLSGRWFGDFRWVGSYQEGPRTTLLWVSRKDRDLLGLTLEGDQLRIYLQPKDRGSVGGEERPLAAYELLQHLLAALRGPDRAGHLGVPTMLPLQLSNERPRGPNGLAG